MYMKNIDFLRFRKTAVVIAACLGLGACISNPNTLAMTGLGAAGGGLLGQSIGQGKGRTIATIAGTILGAATGNHIGSAFDGVSHNRNAVNRNALAIDQNQRQLRDMQMQNQSGYAPSQSFYFGGGSYQTQSRGHSIPLNCSIRNNYVVCNGQ